MRAAEEAKAAAEANERSRVELLKTVNELIGKMDNEPGKMDNEPQVGQGGGSQLDKIKEEYEIFIKIAYLLFKIINSFIFNYVVENRTLNENKESILIENINLLEDLYSKFNIKEIREPEEAQESCTTSCYEKITQALNAFENKLDNIKNIVDEIKQKEKYYFSGVESPKLRNPLTGNVKTIIKLKRIPDKKKGEEINYKEEEPDENYLFNLGLPGEPEFDVNLYHRYLKYKNGDNKILINGYIFSDLQPNKLLAGWEEKNYDEFREKMFPAEKGDSNLIITLGLTGSGKSWLTEKANLINNDQSYEFNFNEEGGKWAPLESIEKRATFSTYENPQSSRSHLLQINNIIGTVVDLAGAEDSFTFQKYIGKIKDHITTLAGQQDDKPPEEKLNDTMLYIKYYLQGHSGLLIREAFNRFKQIKNYWLKGQEGEEKKEDIAFFEKFIETLELYEEMFILTIKEITQEAEGTVLNNIDLTKIREFDFKKFEEYMNTEELEDIEDVESINLEEEISPIVRQIEEKTKEMDKTWWDEGPTISDFNKNIKYPIITSKDIVEMQKVLKWFNPSAPTTPYHNKVFMYFYLRKLYGIEVDPNFFSTGGWNAATGFLLKIKNKQDDFVTEILNGARDNNSKEIFDILKSVPNLKTEREGASPEEADKAKKEADAIAEIEKMPNGPDKEAAKVKQWVDYFIDLTSADQDTRKGAMVIIQKEEIEYNSILGRIIRQHLDKKNSSKNLQIEGKEQSQEKNNEIIKKLRHCYLLLVNYFNRIYEGYMINKTLKELEIRARAKNRKPKLPFGYEYGESSLVELFCYDYLNPTEPDKDNLIQSTFLDKKYEGNQNPLFPAMKQTLGELLKDSTINLSIILALDTTKTADENETLNNESFYKNTIENGINYQLRLYKTRESMTNLYNIFEETLAEIFETSTGEILNITDRIEQTKSTELSPIELTNVLSTGLLKPYSLQNSGFENYFGSKMDIPFRPVKIKSTGGSNKIINQNIRVKELSKLKKLYKELNKK